MAEALLDWMKISSPSRDQGSHHIPSALEDEILQVLYEKQIVMLLDYDGTLSPIVEEPDKAFMSNEMRTTVQDIATYFPTAIVSGRSIHKVYDFVNLPELYYAGSHGMDIKIPPNKYNKLQNSSLFQPAAEFLTIIDKVYKQLLEKTSSTPGAKVENNMFCLSVHYRCVEEENFRQLLLQVNSVLKEYPNLRMTKGRKVLEIRPDIEWHKGKAVEFLLESLGYADCRDVFPIYIGDDKTDEDAFKILRDRGQGIGILVSKCCPEDTNASYSLQEPEEVRDFLQRLVDRKKLSMRALQDVNQKIN